jgi:endonuclease YncB( thermonuclease family)
MKNSRPQASVRNLFVAFVSILSATFLTACNQTVYPEREPTFVYNVAADSIKFWPSSLKYARRGDTVSVLVIGFQRGYVCTEIPDMGWSYRQEDSIDTYRLHSLIRIPGNPTCAVDTKGLDSLYKVDFPTTAGRRLVLQTSAGESTDTLLYIAGNGYTHVFTHLVSGPDSALFDGRFLFHDSGTGNTRRFVTTDSMASCETFQSAAFKRNGDTLTVRVKRIEATPLSTNDFPPCLGPHKDTVEVVLDRYRYP